MKSLSAIIFSLMLLSATAFAGNSTTARVAKNMKKNDIRTVTTTVENTDDNPCMPEGKSYLVELQVKQAGYDRLRNRMIYTWVTAKSINVGLDGSVMEVCAE